MGKSLNKIVAGILGFMVIAFLFSIWGNLSGWLGANWLPDTVENGLNVFKGR